MASIQWHTQKFYEPPMTLPFLGNHSLSSQNPRAAPADAASRRPPEAAIPTNSDQVELSPNQGHTSNSVEARDQEIPQDNQYNRNETNFDDMETELPSLEDIFLLAALKYPTDSNYTDYNPESMSGEAGGHNRDNSVADSDGLKSGQSRDDPILLDQNVPNNGEPQTGLFQAHAGVEIVDRDNTPRRPGSKMRSECRGADSRIPIALSDPQVVGGVGGVVGVGRDEGDDDRDKENSPPVRRSTLITSLAPCEGERANQDLIRRECASDLLRADKDSELEGRLTTDEEEQAGIDDAGENDKGRNNANCRQEKDEKVRKNQPSTKRRKPFRSARGGSSRKRQPDGRRRANHASPPTPPVTRGRAARPCRRKKGLSRNLSPDHHLSQDVNPGLPNTCAAPPSAAPDTDIGMQIVGTLNLSAIGPHAVYALYFRLNDLCWPSQPPTADPKPAIEDELESNGECDVVKIVHAHRRLELKSKSKASLGRPDLRVNCKTGKPFSAPKPQRPDATSPITKNRCDQNRLLIHGGS